MAIANINTEMLIWARERSGFSVSEFARKCQVTEEKLVGWESGAKEITFNQAMTYANKAHIPFGYLFLDKPPIEELPIPDLRTVESRALDKASPELIEVTKLMLQRQEWYKEYLRQHFSAPCQVVGRFSVQDSVMKIVSDMRSKLSVGAHPDRGSWEDYYRDLVKRIEENGILVMRQADLGHHTRPLKVEEFRGFAIVDELAPIIFVNHADSPGARLFTLIHELCHIWIGQSGISDGSPSTHRKEEVLCNGVAAEFLVPEAEFSNLWSHAVDDWTENLVILEGHFHVSRWVLARRALTLIYIHSDEYASFIAEEKARYKKQSGNGGPTYYKTKKSQISQLFSKAVVSQAMAGQLLLREAGQLLGGMKPGNIANFAEELGI